jgi:hypothetical protein
MSIKNFNDSIGNRKRDVPVCSAVPQPTAPPRAPYTYICWFEIHGSLVFSVRNIQVNLSTSCIMLLCLLCCDLCMETVHMLGLILCSVIVMDGEYNAKFTVLKCSNVLRIQVFWDVTLVSWREQFSTFRRNILLSFIGTLDCRI